MLYLEGIETEGESNEELEAAIKAHAKSKGIRVMMCRLIRHRMYRDSVSCKILIPEAQEYIGLGPDVWPENIKCRRWSKEPPRRQYDWRSNQDREDERWDDERSNDFQTMMTKNWRKRAQDSSDTLRYYRQDDNSDGYRW